MLGLELNNTEEIKFEVKGVSVNFKPEEHRKNERKRGKRRKEHIVINFGGKPTEVDIKSEEECQRILTRIILNV